MRDLIGACLDTFAVDQGAEVTLEANPETLTVERLAAFRAAGINRVSLGVQSFLDRDLARLGRIHDQAQAARAFGHAREAGFDNINLDLMLWLPEQSVADCLESVDRAVALSPEHLSIYMLELYPNAPLREEMARAHWSLAPDDDAADMYVITLERLERAGYHQYEISNVARDGRRSRHNLKYWTGGEWLGFGPGAHSTCGGWRTKNVSGTMDYVSRVNAGDRPEDQRRALTPQEQMEEALFLGLRLTDGIDLDAFTRRYGLDVWQNYAADLMPRIEAGLLVYEGGRLRLTRDGMLLSNDVMSVFV